jgi:hypothetical protein
MRAGRLLHATRDSVPEGLAGSGRWDVPRGADGSRPVVFVVATPFRSLREQVGTSNAAYAARLAGAEVSSMPAGRQMP